MVECSVRTADRVVLQHGRSLGELDGCTIEEIEDDAYSALLAAFAAAPHGVTLSADHATISPVEA